MADIPTDHIADTETVFMRNPNNGAVGSCLGAAFKVVYAPQGYTQISQRDWQAGVDEMNEQRHEFVASGVLATLPDGEPEATDIMQGRADGVNVGPSPAELAADAGIDTPGAPDVAAGARTSGARHRGEG